MKFLDLPPIWLVAALILTWLSPWIWLWGPALWVGMCLLAGAAGLTGAALLEFYRVRTTVIPHLQPSALISSGILRWTRNPIYLADVLILAGFALIWGKPAGLLLVPLLIVLLERRFIRPEEGRLRTAFGDAFDRYAARTRRWL